MDDAVYRAARAARTVRFLLRFDAALAGVLGTALGAAWALARGVKTREVPNLLTEFFNFELLVDEIEDNLSSFLGAIFCLFSRPDATFELTE